MLDAFQQRQRGAGSEIKGKAGGQIIAFHVGAILHAVFAARLRHDTVIGCAGFIGYSVVVDTQAHAVRVRSEEHTSELQSLMRNSYADFCLKKKKSTQDRTT